MASQFCACDHIERMCITEIWYHNISSDRLQVEMIATFYWISYQLGCCEKYYILILSMDISLFWDCYITKIFHSADSVIFCSCFKTHAVCLLIVIYFVFYFQIVFSPSLLYLQEPFFICINWPKTHSLHFCLLNYSISCGALCYSENILWAANLKF